ncbi:MAG: beta-ketoacyl synthase N-terminal-like domain-containing protein, partial [Candidatus Competibacterales bacterium]
MTKRRVVITGLGLISPVGNTVATAWEAILKGQSGVGPITHFDADGFAVRIAAEVKGFDPTRHIEPKEARKMDTFIQYGVVAALQAMDDAGLGVEGANPERVGVCIGSGIGGLPGIEEGHRAFLRGGPRKITPFFVPRSIVNMIAGHLSIMRGLKGPNLAVATACTTATHSIGLAAPTIAYGHADPMVAGGAEMATTYTGLGGFAAAKALSTRNDDPGGASRPWDRGRVGFVLGEGAGVLVVVVIEYAKRRGGAPHAEVFG